MCAESGADSKGSVRLIPYADVMRPVRAGLLDVRRLPKLTESRADIKEPSFATP